MHKVSLYLERRDPDVGIKMANVLQVYKEIAISNEDDCNENRNSITESYDEKPRIQAIKNIATQLLQVGGQHSTLQCVHECQHTRTISPLEGINLHTGKVIPSIRDRLGNKAFIEFLTDVVKQNPEDWTTRIILDSHSSHVS